MDPFRWYFLWPQIIATYWCSWEHLNRRFISFAISHCTKTWTVPNPVNCPEVKWVLTSAGRESQDGVMIVSPSDWILKRSRLRRTSHSLLQERRHPSTSTLLQFTEVNVHKTKPSAATGKDKREIADDLGNLINKSRHQHSPHPTPKVNVCKTKPFAATGKDKKEIADNLSNLINQSRHLHSPHPPPKFDSGTISAHVLPVSAQKDADTDNVHQNC